MIQTSKYLTLALGSVKPNVKVVCKQLKYKVVIAKMEEVCVTEVNKLKFDSHNIHKLVH